MALAHPLHPVKSMSRNKRRNLWVGWCVSSWRPWFLSIYSIYYLSNWDKLFLRDIYMPKVDVANDVVLDDSVIHSSLPGFKCVSQLYISGFSVSWYGYTMWHCALVSCTPSQFIGLRWGVRCSCVECHFVFLLLISWVFITIFLTIIGIFMAILFIFNYMVRFSALCSSDFANGHLPGCFHSWTFLWRLYMLPPGSFVLCLDSPLDSSTGEFQALQVIGLAVFGALN